MPIINEGITQNFKLTQTTVHTGPYPGTVTEYGPNETSSSGVYKIITRVDPKNRLIAGPYDLSITKNTPPSLNSLLTYENKTGAYATHSHHITGFVVGNYYDPVSLKTSLNWNRPYLINSVLTGILEQSIDLAVFFRELNQTTKLIRSTASRIANAAHDIQKGKFKAAARKLSIGTPRGVSKKKHWADNWLAYKFGVLPLLSDVDGAMKHLATRARLVRIQGNSRLFVNSNHSKGNLKTYFQAGQERQFQVFVSTSYTKFVFEQVSVEYRLANSFWDELSRLGITNGGTAIWESIPYSFVVDTFLNVGQWLGNMDLGLGLEFVTSSYTQGRRLKGNCVAAGSWSNLSSLYKNYVASNTGSFPGSFEDYVLKRVRLYESDMQFTLLLRSPVSVNNALNDVALVVQRLKTK